MIHVLRGAKRAQLSQEHTWSTASKTCSEGKSDLKHRSQTWLGLPLESQEIGTPETCRTLWHFGLVQCKDFCELSLDNIDCSVHQMRAFLGKCPSPHTYTTPNKQRNKNKEWKKLRVEQKLQNLSRWRREHSNKMSLLTHKPMLCPAIIREASSCLDGNNGDSLTAGQYACKVRELGALTPKWCVSSKSFSSELRESYRRGGGKIVRVAGHGGHQGNRKRKHNRANVDINSLRDWGSMNRACMDLCQMGPQGWEEKRTQTWSLTQKQSSTGNHLQMKIFFF